jgi:hypothetical protein
LTRARKHKTQQAEPEKPTCIRRRGSTRRENERVLPRRHLKACIGAGADWHPPLVWVTCWGCEPCPERHCIVCSEHLEVTQPRTCPGCIGRFRADLNALAAMMREAEEDLIDGALAARGMGGGGSGMRIPGGDLLVMLAGGSPGLMAIRAYLDGDRSPDLEFAGDPQSVVFELSRIVDQWRALLGHRERSSRPVLAEEHRYLDEHAYSAAQSLDVFPDAVDTVSTLAGRLTAAMRAVQTESSGAPCLNCSTPLVRQPKPVVRCRHDLPTYEPLKNFYMLGPHGFVHRTTAEERRTHREAHDHAVTAWFVEHKDCDQGGLDDDWKCPRCGRLYNEQQYRNAVSATYRAHAPAQTAQDLAEQFDLRVAMIWQLAKRGWVDSTGTRQFVRKRGRDSSGRTLYVRDDVERYVTGAAANAEESRGGPVVS